MKMLKLIIIIITSFQFVFYPIAYAQVDVRHGEQAVFSIDDVLIKLKQLLKTKKYEGYFFLNKDRESVSLDDLIRLKDNVFYVHSVRDKLIVKIKVLPIKESEKTMTIALEVFDNSLQKSLSTNTIYIDIKKGMDTVSQLNSVNKQISMIVKSIERNISINSRNISNHSDNIKVLILVSLVLGLFFLLLTFLTVEVVASSVDDGSRWLHKVFKRTSIVLLSTALIAYLAN